MSRPSVRIDVDDELDAYIRGDCYDEDLDAARRVWSSQGVMEVAGSVVLLTYFSVPALLAVRPAKSTRFSGAIDGRLEREFLRTLLGASGHAGDAGISAAGTRESIRNLAGRHVGYAGMDGAYMDFISGLLVIAPLQVREAMGLQVQADEEGFWRYMSHAVTLLGSSLGQRAAVERRCRAFVAEYAGVSALGRTLIRAYVDRHPAHVGCALPLVLPGAREVAESAVAEAEHQSLGGNGVVLGDPPRASGGEGG